MDMNISIGKLTSNYILGKTIQKYLEKHCGIFDIITNYDDANVNNALVDHMNEMLESMNFKLEPNWVGDWKSTVKYHIVSTKTNEIKPVAIVIEGKWLIQDLSTFKNIQGVNGCIHKVVRKYRFKVGCQWDLVA